ncbi:unnamed protein product [Lepeophtheirus salmonis]|uniref:RNA-directed DNA polymerase n=1 Tax=Lepeophtheirus salmonis TaxID=72036 RepID=A0A7R8CKP9_LEPSM|nr:unnamed protein product [Lepeophtheirus salmonis]CAF2850697.1 unnamed protein product [Lepeophtheirus salmonis]
MELSSARDEYNCREDEALAGIHNMEKVVEDIILQKQRFIPHLTIDDNLILSDVINITLRLKRDQILKRLHSNHQGTEKTLKQARQTIFWTGITEDIRYLIEASEEWKSRRSSLPKEPLKSDSTPTDVSQEIATDFFKSETITIGKLATNTLTFFSFTYFRQPNI